MAATAVQIPYATASPAELREAILPESRDEFDIQYRAALDAAATTLRLDELQEFLEGWRRTAWVQTNLGPERYRAMLDRARRITAGERFPTISGEEMKQRIAQRLAAGRQVYRVDPSHPIVVEQVDALPHEALLSYAEVLGVMELNPWAGSPFRGDNPDGNIRTLPFGSGGMVAYMILEREREVHVLEVLWLG